MIKGEKDHEDLCIYLFIEETEPELEFTALVLLACI